MTVIKLTEEEFDELKNFTLKSLEFTRGSINELFTVFLLLVTRKLLELAERHEVEPLIEGWAELLKIKLPNHDITEEEFAESLFSTFSKREDKYLKLKASIDEMDEIIKKKDEEISELQKKVDLLESYLEIDIEDLKDGMNDKPE